MVVKRFISNLKGLRNFADWKLLLFLLLFLDVKLIVKIAAIVLIYILQSDFKFGFSLKNPRLPLFYPAVMLIGVIALVLNKDYTTPHYLLVLAMGLGFWLLCILAIHQVKLFVERNDAATIHRTILIFFAINAAFSLLNMARIILETHTLNPYLYQGEYQKYFMSTGDFIRGVTFDNSTTNAVINAFGVIYFLSRKNAMMTLLCMAVLLLAGSNCTNLILFGILALLFIFKSTRDQKSIIVICLVFFVVFLAKVSPQNNQYLEITYKSIFAKKQLRPIWPTTPTIVSLKAMPDNELSPEQRKQKTAMLYLDSLSKPKTEPQMKDTLPKKVAIVAGGKIIVPKPDLNGPTYQWLRATPPEQKQLADFVVAHKSELPVSGKKFQYSPVPGKVKGFLQTAAFFKAHPAKLLAGTGVGNFSSKLAFRATGLNFTGGYPAKYDYINPLFMVNHLDIYLNYFSKNPELHSLTNSPFSVYDQLVAEYGLPGLLALVLLYLWFFARHYKKLSYGIPLLLFVATVFFIDYWFEQLSVIVLFELLLFLNIKEGKEPAMVAGENLFTQNLPA